MLQLLQDSGPGRRIHWLSGGGAPRLLVEAAGEGKARAHGGGQKLLQSVSREQGARRGGHRAGGKTKTPRTTSSKNIRKLILVHTLNRIAIMFLFVCGVGMCSVMYYYARGMSAYMKDNYKESMNAELRSLDDAIQDEIQELAEETPWTVGWIKEWSDVRHGLARRRITEQYSYKQLCKLWPWYTIFFSSPVNPPPHSIAESYKASSHP